MQLLGKARIRIRIVYRLCFEHRDHPGLIFRFRCDREGVVRDTGLSSASRMLVDRYSASPHYRGWIEEIQKATFCRGLGACECGQQVVLRSPINRCRCGRRFGIAGDEIADVVLAERPAD